MTPQTLTRKAGRARLPQLDKDILNAIQADLPLTARPFAAVAAQLGIDETTLLARLRELTRTGYLRRIGAFFNSAALGYRGTLVAMRVLPEHMADVALTVNRCPLVTHNYQRDDGYNLWCTLQTPSESERQRVLRAWSALPGVEHVLVLPATKLYKTRVRFHLD